MVNIKYSVLMSIYYKEKPEYFRDSVISMLEQTVKPDEIVIVKDGPLTKELEKVICDFKNEDMIKIISLHENKGLGTALNEGIKYCRNELIARMDTDDISKKDRCEKQLKMFLNNESLSIISSSVAEFNDNPKIVNSIRQLPQTHDEIVKYAKKRNPFNHPAVMYKKSEVNKAGGYKHCHLFEDYYLWVRMILNGSICANIKEPLVYMRATPAMFARRGGIEYLKPLFSFKWRLKEIGFYSIGDFLVSVIPRCLIALMPNSLRMFIYNNYLREKIN